MNHSYTIKNGDDEEQIVKHTDYSHFFKEHPHYAIHSKEIKKWFRENQMRFASQDGNSIITVKKNSITAHTQNGKPDIQAMLDLAQANGWQSIKLPKWIGKGDKAFRSALWLEASKRGLEVQGYQPTQLEQQALQGAMAKENDTPLRFEPKQRQPENEQDQLLQGHSLTLEDAHKKIMSIYAEFMPMDSPAYNDIEKSVESNLADLYSKGKSVNPQTLPEMKEQIANVAMPKARQEFHQAAHQEQQKTQTAQVAQEKQHNQHKEVPVL